MIDVLASQAHICLRAQGGHNAGHTVRCFRESFLYKSLHSNQLQRAL